MILSGQSIRQTPRWVRGLVIASAAAVLPLGFTFAQDAEDDLERVEQWLESGVNSALLTQEQADIMLRALEASDNGDVIRLVPEISALDENGNVVLNMRPPVHLDRNGLNVRSLRIVKFDDETTAIAIVPKGPAE